VVEICFSASKNPSKRQLEQRKEITLLSVQGFSPEFSVGESNTFPLRHPAEGNPKETTNKHKKKTTANFIY
jgi:hypothetical protein